MTPSHAACLLLAYRGKHGKVAQLAALYEKLDNLEDNPSSTSPGITMGHSGGTVSDPTARNAARNIALSTRLDSSIDDLEQEICRVRETLDLCPHGEWIKAYYVTEQDDVTWQSLSDDAGVECRTMLRWRADGLQWLCDHSQMWTD